MTQKPAVAAALVLAAVAAAFAAGARKAQAQAPAAQVKLELLAGDRDTSVYFFRHEGRACYVATTRGGAGITMQCR